MPAFGQLCVYRYPSIVWIDVIPPRPVPLHVCPALRNRLVVVQTQVAIRVTRDRLLQVSPIVFRMSKFAKPDLLTSPCSKIAVLVALCAPGQ